MRMNMVGIDGTVRGRLPQAHLDESLHAAAIKRVRPTEKGLIDAMGFDTKETLYEWLTSDVCGEFFKDVYIHRLYPEQQRTGTRSRSPRPEVVKLLIKRREDDGELRYILRRNTHEWTAAGWACYFLLHTRFLNTRYIDGAFFGKQVTESEVDIALWTAYLFLVNKHAPSRLYRTPLLRKFSKDLVAAAQSLHGVPGVKGTKRPAEETETPPSLPQSSKRKKTQKSGHDGASATPAEEAATDTEGQPAAKPTTLDWKEEANAPRKAKRHEPMSVTFNIQDPYWRPSLLRPTFQKAERAPLRTDNDQKHDQGEGEEDDDEDDDEDSDEDDDEDGDGDQKDGDEDLLNAYLEQLLGPGIVGG
jgi:hypothetical protein